jgi:hypothetical protein
LHRLRDCHPIHALDSTIGRAGRDCEARLLE